ncbi:Transcriptional regulator, contains XRE-family HTH domain [Halanaerobium congolense]|uniref:Transcriptional regulator, contains XRE-family HTH domain n=1 Tax=Halanaerobium congolense TaxID=54121 RepID=A0A1I0CJR7_9FIRM|nr:helix-turn-helix transcriptional regulator [Halanaerobium congolense]PTX14826.1 transcriptional regulator with XRE-family HTH domain [Halanaerobium congolense]SDG20513.1 Transcriptional regulator, contains XRE-family HTH domain [Halanaerobium congolense]SET19222.1 Transcriptional regulator, contains XRE-family HTH domain [Halanaerobium congolense]SFP78944.1 Transcriptional regulator, contains XRE-family HTH domain [Halanaerobium congolense]
MDNQIWENLRLLRKDKNKSLKDVSEDLGIDLSYLSRLERGENKNVSFEKIYNLASYYNVTIEQLVNNDLNNFDLSNYDKNIYKENLIQKEDIHYIKLIKAAKSENISPSEAEVIIKLFKKISATAHSSNIKDEYSKYAYKAKESGVSKEKFKNMIEFLIKNEKAE